MAGEGTMNLPGYDNWLTRGAECGSVCEGNSEDCSGEGVEYCRRCDANLCGSQMCFDEHDCFTAEDAADAKLHREREEWL